MTIIEKLDKLRAEQRSLEKLLEDYPDLEEVKTRWRTLLCSKVVNGNPQKVYTAHSCGCCGDAALYLYFCNREGGELIYSNPPYICVGAKSYGEDVWDKDWEDKVVKHAGQKGLELARRYRFEE